MEDRKISNRDEVQARIIAKLEETKTAQQGPELPKGTAMEDEMIKAATPEIIPEPGDVQPEEKKSATRGRGRPKGKKSTYKKRVVQKEKKPDGTTTETVSETEHETPPVERTDLVATIVNGALIPLAAHFLKKEVEHLKIQPDQSKESIKYMPENLDIKPSWPAYIGISLLWVASNAMNAPTRSAETEEMVQLKKALLKSVDNEKLRLEIIEIQKRQAEILEKMNAKMNGSPKVIHPDKIEVVGSMHSEFTDEKPFTLNGN